MTRCVRFVLMVSAWALVPAMAYAQASITGIVRDSSGAVLPGVTVEAASPALIEKVRTAVTDGSGQYRIVDLRPGTYGLAFTLPGFSTVRREGVELTGTFTATVNVQLSVGALEETVTVTGEAPAVDVQNTVRQRVMDREILDSLPISRSHTQLAVLVPGVTTTVEDVGGSSTGGQGAVVAHGSRGSDLNTTLSGLTLGGPRAGGGGTTLLNSNFAAFEEVTVDTGGVDAEHAAGGVRINEIPRNGGNTFRGNFFGAISTESMQSDNYTAKLKAAGLQTPNTIKEIWDFNPGFGGPIRKDKLWFFLSGRYAGAEQYPAGIFYNLNANNPNAWTYAPDTSRRPNLGSETRDGTLRLSWQVAPKYKLGLFWEHQADCYCPESLSATRSLDASFERRQKPVRNVIVDETSPLTSRLLLEAGMLFWRETANRYPITSDPRMIAVTDQGLGNLNFRAFPDEVRSTVLLNKTGRAALSYITGAHAIKVGFHTGALSENTRNVYATQPYSYRSNRGVPNQITLLADPEQHVLNIDNLTGVYGQGRWTKQRLTLAYGLRYDHYEISFPETRLGPGPLVPTRNLTLPATDGVSWNDISPRTAAAYDLFGNGKTALKVTMNKYLANVGAQTPIILGELMAPVRRLVQSTTRSWADANGDFVPDCDLINPAANGECGAMANRNFGTAVPGASYDPDLVKGWGNREYNWEFSGGVQHELFPRVSVDVSYFRRWYGNFVVTDNRALSPLDFDSFMVTAPANPRLPNGGGYQIGGLYNLKAAAFGVPNDDFVTSADTYGKQIEHWNGVDVTFNARPRGGVLLQGGVSTGRTTTDKCEIRAKLPESAPTDPNCRVQTNFLTNVKMLGLYRVPRIDVQLSAAFRNEAGPQILADYIATNAVVAPSLGRNLSGGATNVTVPLVQPGTMYGERRNQLDLRIARIFPLGEGRRVSPGVDIFNLFNASAVLTQSNAYATWLQPQSILFARFVKVGVTVDF